MYLNMYLIYANWNSNDNNNHHGYNKNWERRYGGNFDCLGLSYWEPHFCESSWLHSKYPVFKSISKLETEFKNLTENVSFPFKASSNSLEDAYGKEPQTFKKD